MSYEGTEHLNITTDAGILRIHLNKPKKRNAIDDDMVQAMISSLVAAQSDEAVRSILITSEGDHFCSGFDIVGRNAKTDAPKPRVGSIQRRVTSEAHRLIPLLCTIQVPVVCAARGWVAGIGLHVAAAADFTVVASDATVWEPFAQRGFTPDSGGTWLLPRLVGPQHARSLLMLGEKWNGTDAVDRGLFHQRAEASEVDAIASQLAAKLAAGPTVTLGLMKSLLAHSSDRTLDQQLREESLALELSSRSEDFREGLKAFIDKRDPNFTGR